MSDFQTTTTPAKYRFRIESNLGNIICDREPIGWESGVLEIARDIESGGVFSQFNAGSLVFVGNAAKLLNDLWDTSEFNFEASLIVEYLDNSDGNYKILGNKLKIQPDTSSPRVKVGRTAFGFQVQATDSGLKTKLDKRKDVDVDLTKLISVGGYNIVDFVDPKINLNYPEVFIQNSGRWFRGDRFDMPRLAGSVSYTSVPLYVRTNDFAESQDVSYVTAKTALSFIDPFFANAKFDYTDLAFKYFFQVEVKDKDNSTPWSIKVFETNILGDIVYNETTLETFGTEKGNFNFEGERTISVDENNYLRLAIEVQDIADIDANIRNSEVIIIQSIQSSPAKTVEGLPIAKALKRCLQHILDVQTPLFTPQFGTTDDIYKDDGTKYLTEDQLTFCHLQSGLNIRGELLGDMNSPLATLAISFDDLFNFCQVAHDSGYGITNENGFEQIKIDKYENFFKDNIVLDFSDDLTIYDIETTVIPEVAYSKIQTGFENFEYKEVNGRGEPNTTAKRTSIILTESEFNNVSKKVRGDSKGIFDNLAFTVQDNGTTDTESDIQIFATKTQRSGDEWVPESDENIEIENDSSLFGESLLNRYYTPSRMLRRRRILKTGLTKFPASNLRFQVADKLQTLKTTGTAQSGLDQYTMTENDDILVDDLINPVFGVKKHKAAVSFTFDNLTTILNDPTASVRFIPGIEGYLLNLKKENNKAQAEIEIIEKYAD